MVDIAGKIDSIVFSNKTTGFIILKVKLENGSITALKGSFPGVPLGVGIKATFSGDWVDHPTYGRQFQAVICNVIPEKGRNGIVTYLAANVPSIGPITAAKLYDAFGDELPSVLENEPDRVRALSFLNRNQSEAILKEWSTASEGRTASIFLADLGLTSAQIRSVYTKFGAQTKDITKENPYRLYECPSVGFQTADLAARKLGVGTDDPRRVRAMMLFAMRELSQSEGHMYCTSKQVQDFSRRMFKRHSIEPFSHGEYISDSAFYQALSDLQSTNHLVSVQDRIYLDCNWDHESTSAECLAEMLAEEPAQMGDLRQHLLDFETARNVQLSDEQKQAFFMLERSRVCVISGFPGTGKTLLVSAFVHLFEKCNLHYGLLSPTGIAAKRLSQVTGKPASTIHRALCYQRDGSWQFNVSNKFIIDAVIVDEMSMVDGATFFHLISSLSPTTILILVGDSAQLPSVGAGYVLNNLMKCPDVPHVALTRIYRQEKQSDIISVAHSILRGEPVDTRFNQKSEFLFLKWPIEQVVGEMCKMATALKGRAANFQVIAPMYDGELGVNNLNRKLREVLNTEFIAGKSQKLKHGDVDLYEGDRVMIIKNDYDRAIFNGDVGKITRISTKNDEMEVKIFEWFDQESNIPRYIDKIFTFKIEEARHLIKVAYACTTHKCVSPNTLVETEDGLVRISNIPSEGMIAGRGPRSYKNKVTNFPSNMLRITTVDGYIIEVTPDHGMNVWDDNLGYVQRDASTLCVGDILPLKLGATWSDQPLRKLHLSTSGHPNERIYPLPEFLDSEFAEFLGLMVADGTIYHSGFRLLKSSTDVTNRFAELCRKCFSIEPKILEISGTPAVEVHSSYLARWLLGIDGLSPNNKAVPDQVLRSNLSVQAAFLRGLFEDGTVNIDSSKHVVDHIELVTKYLALFTDVKCMLLRFGVISGFGTRTKILSDGRKAEYKIVYIYGKNISKFARSIGFISRQKQDRVLMDSGIDRNYQIPVLKSEALSVRDSNSGASFFNYSNKNVFQRHQMSRVGLVDILSRAKVKNREYDVLFDRLNYHHSAIKSIEETFGPSMCVEVPEDNQFLQNGFLLRNCQGQEFDYVLMPMTMQYGIMLYRNLIYTAITRAKKKVFIFGDPGAFSYSISNDRDTIRNSHLNALVHDAINTLDAPQSSERMIESSELAAEG